MKLIIKKCIDAVIAAPLHFVAYIVCYAKNLS